MFTLYLMSNPDFIIYFIGVLISYESGPTNIPP